MSERPPRPPFSGGRVVKATRGLGDGAKLTWLEVQVFDRGEAGAWIGAGALAARLGMSRESIERHRRELKAVGLLVSVQRARGEAATWYCTLPEDCVPSARPTGSEVTELAGRLDAHITRARSGVKSDATARASGVNSAPQVASNPSPMNRRIDARVGAELTPLPAHARGIERTSLLPAVEVGGRKNLQPQGGEVAHATDGNGRREAKMVAQAAAPLDDRDASAMAKWEAARQRAAERQEGKP